MYGPLTAEQARKKAERAAKRKERREATPVAVRDRVKLSAPTKRAIYRDAVRDQNGDFVCEATGGKIPRVTTPDGNTVYINPDTGRRVNPGQGGMTVPQPGTFDFGHRPGHEWADYKKEAIANNYDRARVIKDQDRPEIYRLEQQGPNRSRKFQGP
ncbi:GH-E family nuclease [Micromonospora pisi]|uniref:GH-E family nuclease n=1 Tax=Micromonospora pisi TaxID=589240 RepID=UPI0011C3503D|nr:GH-E family nuclease [Micromonospora pisi]